MGTNGLELVHELLLYGSDDELLDTAVPFLRAGRELDEPVLLSCSASSTELIRREFGEDPGLAELDRHEIYATPLGAIAAYQQIVDDYVSVGATRIRLVAEAATGTARMGWAEWGRYEAVVNRVMRSSPVSVICAYDTRSTPPEMLAAGPATHPFLALGDNRRDNPFYVDPMDYLRRSVTTAAEPLESTKPVLLVDDLTDLADLRRRMELTLYRQTRTPEAAGDFMLAVHEVATNALRHGRPPVDVRLWVAPAQLLCTVTDQGEGFDDPLAGYLWPGSPEELASSGMGLWLARRLCDRVDAVRDARGFTVRLLSDLGPSSRRPSRHPSMQ